MPEDPEQPLIVPIADQSDVILARQQGRELARRLGFSVLDQVRVTTTISELARNIVVYGGRGAMILRVLAVLERQGLEMVFEDEGPGIQDLDLAMQQGYTTGNGLGAGLPGSKRLMDEFEIRNGLAGGLYVRACKWR